VSVFRYKAYISYSHQDERHATWLHHALEAYRVPRRLVGSKGEFGAVPGKLAPVFRDRDELSSATDLSEKITSALKESESLVVVCSPASAQSTWVNEEIRLFRTLGRGDRIFCVIVDGDPQSDEPGKACFPDALLEHEDGLQHEPLAADIRKWADGKHLAKSKLVAGILGLRLDELRRRELQRKRKIQAATGIVLVAVIALAVFAFQTRLSEQQAREAQQRDRENAENMLSQFVEATEKLEQTADLQTRKTFNEVASNFLQKLDPDDLSIESRRNLGRILQKQGEISYDEGDRQLAIDLFTDSKAILASIYNENPRDEQAMFDLSQVEYYIGKLHSSQGNYEGAYKSFSDYRDASEKLIGLDPQNADWVMEMAYALSNLGYLEKHRNPPAIHSALEFYKGALQYVQQAILLDESRRWELADFHADLADAWLEVCDLPQALSSRVTAAQLAEQYYLADPANNRLKRIHAFTLAGLANVQRMSGAVGPAQASLQKSVRILNELYQEDPTRLQYRWNLLKKSVRAAHLMYLDGEVDEAWNWYLQLEDFARLLIKDDKDITLGNMNDYASFLIHFSRAAYGKGDQRKTESLLEEGTTQLQQILELDAHNRDALELSARADYYRWSLRDDGSPPDPTAPRPSSEEKLVEPQSCQEVDLRTRQAVMTGDMERARAYSALLVSKGYQEPEFMQFCTQHQICNL
jgi:hypothetical protein